MAAQIYLKGKEHILGGDVDFLNDDISVLLVSADYVPDVSIDESRAAIPDEYIVGEATLSGTTITDGVFDADDITFSELTGDPIKYIVLSLDSSAYSTAWLIAIIDDATSLPLTPDGSDVVISWDSNGIFGI